MGSHRSVHSMQRFLLGDEPGLGHHLWTVWSGSFQSFLYTSCLPEFNILFSIRPLAAQQEEGVTKEPSFIHGIGHALHSTGSI